MTAVDGAAPEKRPLSWDENSDLVTQERNTLVVNAAIGQVEKIDDAGR